MRVELKLVNPLATYQSIIGDLFSVISMHTNYKNWLCSNINQLVYFRDPENREFSSMGFFYEHQSQEYQYMYFDIPLLETNKINYASLNVNILEFIMSKINDEYYIRLPINMCNVKESDSDRMHMVFVHGYDDERKEVYISNFHNGKKYARHIYSFGEIEKGFRNRKDNVEEYLSDVIFFKLKKSKYPIWIDKIINELSAFLASCDIYQKYKYSIRWNKCQIYYGEQYFDELIYDLKLGCGDLRAIYVIYDFMKIIKKKAEILVELNYLAEKSGEIIIEEITGLIDEIWLIILKYIYFVSKNPESHFMCNEEGKKIVSYHLLKVKQGIHQVIELLLDGLKPA